MIYVLVIILVGLMAMVLISLLRGLNSFRQSMDQDGAPGSGPTEFQFQQNRMMWARIKYQALAVGVIVILLVLAR
jgi:hypothetical protein